MNRHFLKEYTDGQWHMKRCSTLLIIRDLQIEATMTYHLTSVRIAIIKKTTNNNCRREYGGKGTLVYCRWECELFQQLCKTVWRFLKKLKVEVTCNPAVQLLGVCVCVSTWMDLEGIKFSEMIHTEKRQICYSIYSTYMRNLKIKTKGWI